MTIVTLLAGTVIAEDRATFPTEVYWGDTHVHTYLSSDAYIGGARLTPDQAYRFARGETVRTSGGRDARLIRPLDFLMVADHAENLGVMAALATEADALPDSAAKARWQKSVAELPNLSSVVNSDTLEEFLQGGKSMVTVRPAGDVEYELSDDFRRSAWERVIVAAENHNTPGEFTTFIGFEWTARFRESKPNMIHRNVMFADGANRVRHVLPYSRYDSNDVEDLWAYLEDYEARFAGQAIAIPHNGNISGGGMFALRTIDGEPFTQAYASKRARWEPVVEVTQLKGDGETHPLLSPDDAFADFETWPPPPEAFLLAEAAREAADSAKGKSSAKKGKSSKKGDGPGKEKYSYTRSALKLGLDQQHALGANPFKFGMIGSTDSHTGMTGADEASAWGVGEPGRYRAINRWYYNSSGYAAVWAAENTRESLFAALKRRETYATTGPRMVVRFFAGWDFAVEDADQADFVRRGYSKGVPIGGDLTRAPVGASPRFLISAAKDPHGANLDRIQVIKGWRSVDGKLHEKVYDVALSDDRTVGKNGETKAVGDTVDIAAASYTNTIGDPELVTVWKDPDFDDREAAFYYVRVLQIPTPRWTVYDAKRFEGEDTPENIAVVIQDRAYTSPIWYTP